MDICRSACPADGCTDASGGLGEDYGSWPRLAVAKRPISSNNGGAPKALEVYAWCPDVADTAPGVGWPAVKYCNVTIWYCD